MFRKNGSRLPEYVKRNINVFCFLKHKICLEWKNKYQISKDYVCYTSLKTPHTAIKYDFRTKEIIILKHVRNLFIKILF